MTNDEKYSVGDDDNVVGGLLGTISKVIHIQFNTASK